MLIDYLDPLVPPEPYDPDPPAVPPAPDVPAASGEPVDPDMPAPLELVPDEPLAPEV